MDFPTTLEAFSDDDPAHLGTRPTTLLRKELFLLFTLNLPSHVFVYHPLLYHPGATAKSLNLFLHYCPAGHLEVSPQPPLHHLNQGILLPPASCSSDPQHGKTPMVLRGSLGESEWPGM